MPFANLVSSCGSPKDFVKKLQFTGPISTGNAIKTVYASTIIGRFMAADSNNELRESVTRDYFGAEKAFCTIWNYSLWGSMPEQGNRRTAVNSCMYW